MGLRSTAGSLRAFPTLGRRTFASEVRLDDVERRLDDVGEELGQLRHLVADQAETIGGTLRRLNATESLLEQVHATLRSADPEATFEVVAAVQDNVRELTVQVTEQMNRTSAALKTIELSTAHQS